MGSTHPILCVSIKINSVFSIYTHHRSYTEYLLCTMYCPFEFQVAIPISLNLIIKLPHGFNFMKTNIICKSYQTCPYRMTLKLIKLTIH